MNQARANDIALLILRVGLGVVMLYFGSQKLMGWFGGQGFPETVDSFHDNFHIPKVMATLAIFAEVLGGLGVLFGLVTRVAALGIACTMAVAFWIQVSMPHKLESMQTGHAEGVAAAHTVFLPFLLCLAAMAILLTGAGNIALDKKLFGGMRKKG